MSVNRNVKVPDGGTTPTDTRRLSHVRFIDLLDSLDELLDDADRGGTGAFLTEQPVEPGGSASA
jgi:hypothetical protein